MQGIVMSKNANIFSVRTDKGLVFCSARGSLKEFGIFVGDNVEFLEGEDIIETVQPRKNKLVRPPLANIDKLFIVIAPLPKPDFLLVDKIIIYSFLKGITPLLIINKSDIASKEFIKSVEENYNDVLEVLKVSAHTGCNEISEHIVGLCAFAGQSAVGKSSLVNSLLGGKHAQVGHLSKKIARGKQTTRVVTLYEFEKGFLADTAGFSMLDLSMITDLKPNELSRYYPDFTAGRKECKYRTCKHENSTTCGVMERVKQGKISRMRYLNYLVILNSLK